MFAGVRADADGDRLRAAAGERLQPVTIDVTEPATIAAVAEALGDAPLDGLVNNAGTALAMPLEFLPLDQLRRQLEVNLVGHVAVTQALLPNLRSARGRIVNVGSIAGRSALPFLGTYAASKHALRGSHRFAARRAAAVRGRGGRRGAGDDRDADLAEGGRAGPGARGGAAGRARRALRGAHGGVPQRGSRRGPPGRACGRRGDRRRARADVAAPKARYVVGRDARRRALVERLPTGLRDRVYERVLLRR